MLYSQKIATLQAEKVAFEEGAGLYERVRVCEDLSERMEPLGMWASLDWRQRRDELMRSADLPKIASAIETLEMQRGSLSPNALGPLPGADSSHGEGTERLAAFLQS